MATVRSAPTPGSQSEAVPGRRPMPPVLRGVLWATIGFVVVDLLVSQLFDPFRGRPLVTTVSGTIAWLFGFVGWLLGVGAWEGFVLPVLGYREPVEATDWRRYFQYSTDHKVIGLQYLGSALGGFLIAGLDAMIFRLELMKDHLWIFSNPGAYLTAVGIHGSIMVFSVANVALIGGLGNYFIPLMIGSRNTVFSRLSGLSVWMVPAGILTVVFSPLAGYWDTGWRAYEPLAAQDPGGIVFFYLGIFAITLSSLLVALNLTATIIFRRAPGVTWSRLPMYAWGLLVVSLLNLMWLPEIQTTFVLSLLNRIVPLPFFSSVGSPLTFVDLFWLFGHPEVYIIVVPVLALWQEIIPVMTRKTLFARQWGVVGVIFVMMLSGMVWAHHMFTNIRNSEILPFSFFTEMISVPTGFAYMTTIGTMWKSRMRLTAPMVLVLMSMFNFFIGGITGVFLADPAVNLQLHDTFWVVGHFHYTIIGSLVFTGLAALYYWLPKLSGGRTYYEKPAIWGAIWIFVAFNATFSQMFLLGLQGMNRWVAVYPPYLQPLNFEVSLWAFLLGLGFIYNIGYIIWCWAAGPKAAENPWQAKTLEWTTATPIPRHNFDRIPRVVASFYRYGESTPDSVVAAEEMAATVATEDQPGGGGRA
ncbi:Cytochrome C oxidase subunit I [Candidatus Hydrogenisulfobacillus filiaventi]|uniref:Cytochrome C oxidase subunit I n=1 Tax=Candidatus Hydrogenisulfobacillus filiaventi TaxID=2707344 RepID=A0A6F8ZC89_9FIRM|nr:Cytochrome C oxidase subunit I [Candidatus Hydrogenisulfobacillus filiaventi]